MAVVRRQPVVPPHTIAWYLPGHNCYTAKPGDIILVRYQGNKFFHKTASRLIRFGAWIRKKTRPFSWTEHAMVCVTGGLAAKVVQETPRGAVLSSLNPASVTDPGFIDYLYCVISPTVPLLFREQAVTFALWTIGEKYGWVSIPSDALQDLTGFHFAFSTYGRMVCSSATCRAAERWGLIPDRDPDSVQPCNLASYFNVTTKTAYETLKKSRVLKH